MRMFGDYYEEDYDPIKEYERGIKPFHEYDAEDIEDEYEPCIY